MPIKIQNAHQKFKMPSPHSMLNQSVSCVKSLDQNSDQREGNKREQLMRFDTKITHTRITQLNSLMTIP